jgi:predicted N-formylglutamate amidohydrolase
MLLIHLQQAACCGTLVPMDAPRCHRFLAGRRQDLLVICDHAGNALPPDYQGLGLGAEELLTHVAWDPGAEGVARTLAHALECPAILGVYSRLLVDLNRAPDDADLFVCELDGVRVPANLGLDEAERQHRIACFHRPYHLAIQAHLVELEHAGIQPLLISVHSFTPVLHGRWRPWPVGLLWKQDTPLLQRLFGVLAGEGLEIGDNQPYDGRAALGHTLDTHGLGRGLQHLLIELRQDLLRTNAEQEAWGLRLWRALRAAGVG